MKKTKKEIAVYEFNKNYFVEVFVEENVVEFWLCRKEYGIKKYMFGLLKDDLKDEQDIIDIINANIKEHISYYKYDYED